MTTIQNRKMTKPLNSSACIFSKKNAMTAVKNGSDTISFGAIALLRPWRIAQLVRFMAKISK